MNTNEKQSSSVPMKEKHGCICSPQAVEPKDSCPVHGIPPSSKEQELKPCPFCGAPAYESPNVVSNFGKKINTTMVDAAHKNDCPMRDFTIGDISRDGLLERWNRRTPSQDAQLSKALQELEAEKERVRKLVEMVNKQAEDEGLWFVAETASEGYLQQELRKLHDAVESLSLPAPKPEEDKVKKLVEAFNKRADTWEKNEGEVGAIVAHEIRTLLQSLNLNSKEGE